MLNIKEAGKMFLKQIFNNMYTKQNTFNKIDKKRKNNSNKK